MFRFSEFFRSFVCIIRFANPAEVEIGGMVGIVTWKLYLSSVLRSFLLKHGHISG